MKYFPTLRCTVYYVKECSPYILETVFVFCCWKCEVRCKHSVFFFISLLLCVYKRWLVLEIYAYVLKMLFFYLRVHELNGKFTKEKLFYIYINKIH